MSVTTQWTSSAVATPEVAKKLSTRAFVVGLVAALGSAFGFITGAENFMQAYLVGYLFWLCVTFGCLGWLMIHYIAARGGWGLIGRRIWEAGVANFPLMFVLGLPILFNLPKLYIWARPAAVAADEHLRYVTGAWLSMSGVWGRYIGFFAIWIAMAFLLRRWSAEQDLPENEGKALPFQWVAAPGLVIFALTSTFLVVDFSMSLDPAWASSIYGLIFVASSGLACMALTVIVTATLSNYQPMATLLTRTTLHDYGKWCFAVIMLWAYFSFSQWLIIWAGNLPEEIGFFRIRLQGGWEYASLFLALFGWAVPWGLLLSQDIKKSTRTLVPIACWILFMRLFDVFWYVKPSWQASLHPGQAHLFGITPWDILLPIAIGGFWLGSFFWNLRQRPLLPLYAPFATQVLEGEHAHD